MKRVLISLMLLIGLTVGAAPSAAFQRREKLETRPSEMLEAALHFSEKNWDEKVGLLRSISPGDSEKHGIRESAWYALGLMLRNESGDQARAVRIIEKVLATQLDAPGQRWDGTYRRALEEPIPSAGAKLWENFDPNWRQFVGTTLALVLIEFENRLPAGLPARMEDSIRRAVEGELTQGRDEAYHTNIMLMHGFLWSWAGQRLGRPEWIKSGEQWAEKVAAEFAINETFHEYNSPTYYGVDLYGLALWRRHGATERIRTLGAKLEAGLWRDIGRFYHAGLRNMCGPFDRAYGMDMQRYVSLTGVWMSMVLPKDRAPLPDPAGPMGHAHDFVVTPAYVALGVNVPREVRTGFDVFEGERILRRPITETRIATAWLARDVMIGGEITGHTLRANPKSGQLHPATIHWRVAQNDIGWMRLYDSPLCDAEAARETLKLNAVEAGDFVLRLSAPGLSVENFARDSWNLPGLKVQVTTDATDFTVTAGKDFVDVRYAKAKRVEFQVSVAVSPPATGVARK